MKLIVAAIAAILCGVSFHLGHMHGKGELTPAIEAKLSALKAWLVSKLPARVQGWLGK